MSSANLPNSLPKRFLLSLSVGQWRRLAAELQSMEHAPHSHAVPVEKQIERDRAGEQLAAHVTYVVGGSRDQTDEQQIQSALPLLRSTAKYLLTACDRLRRAALRQAWQLKGVAGSEAALRLLAEARLWDGLMREISDKHGVVHPLNEMVAPLPISDAELGQLGLPVETLLNGHDLLAQ